LALTLSGTAFLAIQTTTYAFNQALGQLFDVYNFDVAVSLASPQTYDQVQARILAVPNVKRVERVSFQTVKTQQGQLQLEGFESNAQVYHYQLIEGRWFNGDEPNALVLSNIAADRMHLKVGDKLTLSGPTSIKVVWTIVGEVRDINGSTGGQLGAALTTMDNLNAFNGLPRNLAQTMFVQATDRSSKSVNQMVSDLDKALSNAGLSPTIITAQQNKDSNLLTFRIVYIFLYAVAALVALVGILGLFNTLTTSVFERRREIGILRSMGASSWRIGSVFWIEGLSLAVIAWLVAIILGIPGAYAFIALIGAELVPVPFAFDPTALFIMLIFIIVIATLASFGPAMRASRARIADILRYE
jgi:putative ABC transport system permease protein